MTIISSAGSSKVLKLYVGGNGSVLFWTLPTAITNQIGTNTIGFIKGTIIRQDASNVRVYLNFSIGGTAAVFSTSYGVGSWTSSSTNVIRLTGTSTGGSFTNTDIVGRMGTIIYASA